jgi:hypothetical protein
MNLFLKETANKSVIIADQKVELEHPRSLVNEPTALDEAPQQALEESSVLHNAFSCSGSTSRT